jgi:hypothetical protein
MTYRPSALERAFELARSGKVASIETIKLILRREGYDGAQLAGPHLIRQLRLLIYSTRAPGGRALIPGARTAGRNAAARRQSTSRL